MALPLSQVLKLLPAVKFSGNCCILASLTIRDVLRRLGHVAKVRSVGLVLQASEGDVPLHSIGVGMNKLWKIPYLGKDWDGHLVVTTADWLIDPTFYNARRQAWEWIPDVAIVQRNPQPLPVAEGLPVIAHSNIEKGRYLFTAHWLAYSRNRGWEQAKDVRPERRRDLVEEVLTEFNTFQDKEPSP